MLKVIEQLVIILVDGKDNRHGDFIALNHDGKGEFKVLGLRVFAFCIGVVEELQGACGVVICIGFCAVTRGGWLFVLARVCWRRLFACIGGHV